MFPNILNICAEARQRTSWYASAKRDKGHTKKMSDMDSVQLATTILFLRSHTKMFNQYTLLNLSKSNFFEL